MTTASQGRRDPVWDAHVEILHYLGSLVASMAPDEAVTRLLRRSPWLDTPATAIQAHRRPPARIPSLVARSFEAVQSLVETRPCPPQAGREHLERMIKALFVSDGLPEDKVARWLGYVDGCLAFHGVRTVSQAMAYSAIGARPLGLVELAMLVGFVQGWLVASELLDVDAERDRTRPILHRAYAGAGVATPATMVVRKGSGRTERKFLMSERVVIPFPEGTTGAWLLEECAVPAWHGSEPDARFVDVGWSAGGTRDGYRHVGSFANLAESRIAIEAMNATILQPGGKEPHDIRRLLEENGFSRPPPHGFSHSSSGVWQKEIGERWFVWFGDDLMDTSLTVADRSRTPNTQTDVGRLHMSVELDEATGYDRTLAYRGLLAILQARTQAGSPGTMIADAEDQGRRVEEDV